MGMLTLVNTQWGIIMSRRVKSLLLPMLALGLATAACGNSGDEAAPETTTAPTAAPDDSSPPDSAAPSDGTYPDRDTFVELSGVPGVTDTEIQYASLAVKANNPLGTDVMDAFNEGINAYFAWRNSEGGIYGRQLVLKDKIDDELALNQAKALELISADNRFGVFVATLLFTGSSDLNDAGIPTYVWNIHATEFAGKPALFGNTGAGCTGCTSRTVPYLAHLSGAKKVAAIGYGASENSKLCAVSQKDSFERYASDLDFELTYFNNDLAFGLPNGIGPEVTAMKDAGVEFISTCMDLNGMKTLAQELQRQGMDDVVLYHPNTYNQQFVADAGGIFDGDYIAPGFGAFEYETGLESQDKFFEYMELQGSDISELAMVGWINADLAFQGLLEAGPEFSRQSVIDATNRLTAYDAGGLINPIDWTRQHNAPDPADPTTGYAQECSSPIQVKDGKFVPVSEPTKPFLCWPNTTLDWSEPTPTSFGS